MKKLLLAVVVFALSHTSAYASASCRQNPLDIFEPQQGMPAGKHKGACLKNEAARTLYLPEESELRQIGYVKTTESEGKAVVVNVSHNDQFYLAEIPINKISRVIYQLKRFFPEFIAAHTQLRFDFSEPVTLKSQLDGKTEVAKINSLIFSTEAMFQTNGPKYNLIKGTFGEFGVVYRLISLDQEHQSVVKEGKNVEQFRLNFTAQQAQSLFKQILARHSNKEIIELYNTITLNCTNVLFANIDIALKQKGTLWKATRATLPVLSPSVLKELKLIETSKPNEPTFNIDSSGLMSK